LPRVLLAKNTKLIKGGGKSWRFFLKSFRILKCPQVGNPHLPR
jgi:hypothetical protein